MDAPGDYADLLAQTGWRARDREDVTAEFARLARILVEGTVARREALTELMGSEDFAERLQHRQNQLAALEHAVLKRERFLAVAGAT